MKFIHVSDVHLGAIPDIGKPWSKERSLDIKNTFENVIKKVRAEEAQLLLISGDLFHNQPLIAELAGVNELFKTIPNTKVIICAGSADRLKKTSPLTSFRWASNVHYVLNDKPTCIPLSDLNVDVYSFSYWSKEIDIPMIDSVEIYNPQKINILLAYAGTKNHVPIDIERLKSSRFSYCALGSMNRYMTLIDDKAYFAGRLEPLDIFDTGAHGIIVGEIDSVSGKLENTRFEVMSNVSYVSLEINVSKTTKNEELVETIRNEIVKRGTQNIYKLKIVGTYNPSARFNLSSLQNSYRILGIEDNSDPGYDFASLFRDHSSDVIGSYIRYFLNGRQKELSYTEKKALFYGINALLKTKTDFTNN